MLRDFWRRFDKVRGWPKKVSDAGGWIQLQLHTLAGTDSASIQIKQSLLRPALAPARMFWNI